MDVFLDRLISLALEEDLGAAGDITTEALVPVDAQGSAELIAKERLVLAGLDTFARVFVRVDPDVKVELLARDGQEVQAKALVARVHGRMRALLTAERTALNIVQRTSGMATMAQQVMAAVRGTKLRILDTRKTAPGMRSLSKQAVKAGGAFNHRFGLFDGVLIKDNHIAAVGGSVREALRRARTNAPQLVKIEIEVTNLEQLAEALEEGADVVMLDNMDDEQIRRAVELSAGRIPLEVSGGITLERLPRLAKLGVDFVSMGALTHSARAMDLSLEIVQAR
ncbi:nicotinate-nucleotide pyrophosphorylase [carboxylating] [Archangium gephyra]|uniref:Probable nicotinate-nucleotide pyrophosphorylase [carboxylating] n=1 Tax=Archangium gephyra TaxID=48 RepID=A0AAC8TEC2_9BACT|nr:carboxylating nicotinate-nucleotide diphosphorylase [Archangium gephyra]AKJ02822.1 Quinolinate phosphoribosyltransferase [Archangium gephyra]REG24953.1 nicotinate-nucleotide pyrophosphorylase [carboxylating] [Archangium gephyra]